MRKGRLTTKAWATTSIGAVGLALVAGCGGMSAVSAPQGGTVTVTVSASAPAPAVSAAPLTTTVIEPVATATPPATQAPVTATSASAPGGLDETQFWQLVEDTRRAAGNDTGRQSELLKNRLTQLSPAAIVEFARIRHRFDQQAYTYNLWAAATVIADGCSDDCFRDFRGYIISLGRVPYENAIKDPDSLASVAQDEETGDWENADNVAPDAYSSRTSDDFPLDDTDLSGRPSGKPFNENDTAGLARRYPRLAARFR